jgi:hypothetical protein
MPKSLVARIDAVETRLSVVADAIKAVRPHLSNFYAKSEVQDDALTAVRRFVPTAPTERWACQRRAATAARIVVSRAAWSEPMQP